MRRFMGFLLACLLAACSANLAVLPDPAPATSPAATLSVPTEVPSLKPTPLPLPTPTCPGAPPTRLIRNERGRVLPDDPRPVNLRSAPSVGDNLLTSIPILKIFFVLDGPVCNGDYAWYEIRYGNYTGWIAEGDLTSYYVESYLPD